MSKSLQTTEHQIISTRLIPASVERIFKATTEAEHLVRWWGPKGFSATFHEFNPVPDGKWKLDMHGPDGTNYPNTWVFEVVEPERIVLRHLGEEIEFLMTITLAEEAGGTRITWVMTFNNPQDFEHLNSFAPKCNEENFDRLESELARIPDANSDERDLFLVRIIGAPREKVYQAWTEPELLKQWFAPLPYTTPEADLDVRSGGSNTIVMRDPDGNDMQLHGVYLEVVENEKLVSTDAYTSAWEPSEKPFITIVLTFEDSEGRTRYTAQVRHWSVEDRDAHEKQMHFREGWGKCTDQLAELVENL